jgi:serine/threonine protein kinase/tetratricopeptide (TPR) repeat protein
MTPERWRALKVIYHAALALEGTARRAYLLETCKEDPAALSEIEAMLAMDAQLGDFLERPATQENPRRVGPYELVRELARGGMGVVYLAERVDDEYRKRVAIKLLPRDLGSEFFVARFRQERQILAALVHPNIASLLDGGTTPDGLPFFAMEYVEGEAIDAFCDVRRLSLSQRLEIFLGVCAGVQYAHRSLVIHRDLKPSNIVVTPDGQAKLLDFGIAKLLEADATLSTSTAPEMRLFTLSFASPEQIRGRPITTSSDVYSLGVLLYLLATGRRPFGEAGESLPDLARTICDDEPKRPSLALVTEAASAVREGSPQSLRRRLSGDVDAIILKCLRKEPDARYGSVEQLADDIGRHLSGLPVTARRGGFSYRTGKFLSRHRAAVAAASVVSITLAVGVAQTVRERARAERERARAERRFNDVRKLATSFLFDFHGAIEHLPGSTRAEELIVQRAEEYLEGLASESAGDRSLQAELASAYDKLAEIQGGANVNLGNTAHAQASYEKAVAIREALLREQPGDGDCAKALAFSLSKLGMLRVRRGELSAGVKDIERATSLVETRASKQSDPATWKALALSYDSVGAALEVGGEYPRALEYRRKELDLFERVAAADPTAPTALRNVALTLKYIGGLLEHLGRPSEAAPVLQRAVAIDAKRVQADPTNSVARLDLSFSEGSLGGTLGKMGKHEEAIEAYRRAVALADEMGRADSANFMPPTAAATAWRGMAEVLLGAGRSEEAFQASLEAVSILERLARLNPDEVSHRARLGQAYAELGDAKARWAESSRTPGAQRPALWREAQSWYQKSEDVRLALSKAGKTVADYEVIDSAHNAKQLARCADALSRRRDE